LKVFAVLITAILFLVWLGKTFHYDRARYLSVYHSTEPIEEDSVSRQNPSPLWLIATITPAHSLQRRAIIRATWQTLYGNTSLITMRFVLANPGKRWAPVIAHENKTFGDLIVLNHLEESAQVANTIKSIEFFKYLKSRGERYPFVSKLDDDSFVDAATFYESYLAPLLSTKASTDSSTRTIIARELQMNGFLYPGGQFYTMTWDMVVLVSTLYERNPIVDEHEDVLIGRLLHESNESWRLQKLSNEIAFDYDDRMGRKADGKDTAWAAPDDDLTAWVHAIGPGAINPHKMRGDEEYLKVAECYGSEGLLQRATIDVT